MKALILILSLILLNSKKSLACSGAFGDAIANEIINTADYIAKKVNGKLTEYSKGERAQQTENSLSLRPIDMANDLTYSEIYKSFGILEVKVKDSNGKMKTIQGSSFKIGKSCVMTDAHVLFPYANLQDKKDLSSDKLESPYQINFIRNHMSNDEADSLKLNKETTGRVLFAMVNSRNSEEFKRKETSLKGPAYNEAWDYEVNDKKIEWETVNGQRIGKTVAVREFQGNSEPAIVKLDKSDDTKVELNIFDTKTIDKKQNPYGVEIECLGIPETKMNKKYGTCTGNELVWKTSVAHIYKHYGETSGTATTAPFEKGFSGGACFFKKNGKIDGKVFGLPANGILFDERGQYIYPNLKFENEAWSAQNARFIASLVRLDERLKRVSKSNGEKYSGLLEYIKENCN